MKSLNAIIVWPCQTINHYKNKKKTNTQEHRNYNSFSPLHDYKFECHMLGLRVTLRLQEDKPSTHQNVCGGRFMSGVQMDKTQYKNVLT